MRSLLWIGDAACPSGFARATHETLDVLRYSWDVTVLGLNYRGDPHSYPYPIYAAMAEGDAFGINRLGWMIDLCKPDLIVIQNDPWNIPQYTKRLKRVEEFRDIPIIGSIAVDGLNCRGEDLNDLVLAVFWTKFGFDEARRGGYKNPGVVIPLGVDLNVYKPMNQQEARFARSLSNTVFTDAFIVGNVNRNQPRKRLDLTIKYFAEWIKAAKIDDAYLYLHVAPTGDTGTECYGLMKYYGVGSKLILMEPPTFYGISEAQMAQTYNTFDVCVSTTQGEGFGLTTLEAMACGIPCVVPNWAALGDWPKGAVWHIPCTSTAIGPPYVNVIGGVPDRDQFLMALSALYRHPEYREQNSRAALERAREPRFHWPNIGQAFSDAIDTTLLDRKIVEKEAAWKDLGRPVEVTQ